MIYKMRSPIPLCVRVVFELPASILADRIYLVGDFNNWDQTATPMHQTRHGVWRVVLDLPANRRFEFRYLIDQKWHTDYHADGIAPSPYHTSNSVVDTTLPLKALHMSKPQRAHPQRKATVREKGRVPSLTDDAEEEMTSIRGWQCPFQPPNVVTSPNRKCRVPSSRKRHYACELDV